MVIVDQYVNNDGNMVVIISGVHVVSSHAIISIFFYMILPAKFHHMFLYQHRLAYMCMCHQSDKAVKVTIFGQSSSR